MARKAMAKTTATLANIRNRNGVAISSPLYFTPFEIGSNAEDADYL
jgi:hypothetical protein